MQVVTRSLLIAGAFALVTSAASAQIVAGVHFTTSFDFTVGSKTLPAGSYTITPLGGEPQLLTIADGHRTLAIVEASAVSPDHRSQSWPEEVLFVKTDRGYVLCQVWDGSGPTGEEIAGTFPLMREVRSAPAQPNAPHPVPVPVPGSR